MSYPLADWIVRYPLDDFDEGINVGPFESEVAAREFLADHPVASTVEPACTEEHEDAYPCQLRSPVPYRKKV